MSYVLTLLHILYINHAHAKTDIIAIARSHKTTDDKDTCVISAQVACLLQPENVHALTGKGNP